MLRVARYSCAVGLGCGAAAVALRQRRSQAVAAKEASKSAFNPDQFKPFALKETIPLSHDSALFRFALPNDAPEMGLPVASCILTRCMSGAEEVIRPYTPTTLNDTRGHFDLVIKKYPNAKMGGHIFSLKPGDTLEVKGPIKKIDYVPNQHKHLGMVAGGTGITPMYQVIQEILKNPSDRTQVDLIYANRSPADILLKKELDALAQRHPNFKVHYTVDAAEGAWPGEKGHVTPAMVQKYFPGPQAGNFVYVCGPNPMVDAISGGKAPDWSQGELKGVLKSLGYSEANVFKF